jgi:hypothetical protein
MYNLNYAPTTLGVQVEEKLYVGVREQKRLNTAGLEGIVQYTVTRFDNFMFLEDRLNHICGTL